MIKKFLLPVAGYLLGRTATPKILRGPVRPDAPPFGHRGPYAVGTFDSLLPHKTRPLKLSVWYPADVEQDELEEITYSDGPAIFSGFALRNAPFLKTETPCPLVIFSHASGGTRLQSVFFTEHLASHGFVVMAVDHPGNTIFDGLTQPEKFEENRLRGYIHRPEDVIRQIDYAETLNNERLQGMIDLERVVVAGHSFGGYTALAVGGACLNFDSLNAWCDEPENKQIDENASGKVCYLRHHVQVLTEMRDLPPDHQGLWPPMRDPRVKAVVALAPWNGPIFGAEGLSKLTLPTLILVGSEDKTTPHQRDAYPIYEQIGSSQKALVTYQNGGHYLFTGECTEIMRQFGLFDVCSDHVWDMARAHDILNHFVIAFLRSVLYDDAEGKAALSPSAVEFTGIRYSSHGF